MQVAPIAWADVPVGLAAAPGSLGLAGIRLGMPLAEVTSVAPSLEALPRSTRTSADLATQWVLSKPVRLGGTCAYKAEVGGDDRGVSDISLRLLSGSVEKCSREIEQRFAAALGPPQIQANKPPSVASTYYIWDGVWPASLEVSYFYGGGNLTWLALSFLDKRRSPYVLK